MKLLVIGATGQLGGDLLRNNVKHEIYAPARDELDLAQPDKVATAVRRHRPDVIVNCAAFHNVPLCEEQPEQAFFMNCVAVRNLAALSLEIDAWFFTFSSDYVFGGDNKHTPYLEDDKPAPVQTYGITRLAGEHAALAVAPQNSVVIRTCGLYGRSGARSKGGNFVDGRVADVKAGRRIEMASEQIVAPTSTDDLSFAVLKLIEHPRLAPGIYHLVNEGECSWYQLTCAIVEILGAATEVIPVDRGGLSGSMRRPLYSVLANTRARSLGITLRPWREALRAYLESKYR
ncbi:MAG TPA: dTDP-4-dehydrorhamnose reductase [Burkholderiales bacterium]|nr:dTDP-4-dehydrorhamnose reductase [Burkholderiales bacterium]